MNNKDLYKKAMDEIHAPEELKRKTLNKIQEKKNPKVVYMRYLAACAVFVVAIAFGTRYVSENGVQRGNADLINDLASETSKTEIQGESEQLALADLPTFKDFEELKSILEENYNTRNTSKSYGVFTDFTAATAELATNGEEATQSSVTQNVSDYSQTNIQVEGVDEADITKTDGKNIYYLANYILHIIDADTLEELATIDYMPDVDSNESFSPREFYLVKDKLVVLGNYYAYEVVQNGVMKREYENIAYTNSSNFAEAIIYDISSPDNPKVLREVKLDGNYSNSRMIGNNLYFISTKTPYYFDGVKEEDILPCYTNGDVKCYIPANRIVYFDDTNYYNYVLIAGVDISKNDEVNVASFFGSWPDKIYASENNLYLPITKSSWWYDDVQKNEIYKFSLKDAKVEFVAKGTFEGYLDSQFSIDEYNDYLRIATTSGYDKTATNTLYVFNNKLEEVSKITDIAEGERIYSVRFMGKIGYIVTFEQIDPLFVVDLSDPENPKVKGELEIPGYSSYLHPYDETHIIGIGYNVKPNGYGGVTNANMKMAMFDVSDLENPREMFSVNIGEEHVYSELDNNHKALFYSQTKNLIGFPYTTWDSRYNSSKSEFALYDIDLEKGFIEHGIISIRDDYRSNIQRAIYIGDNLYTLANNAVTKYDLNTLEELEKLEFQDSVSPYPILY